MRDLFAWLNCSQKSQSALWGEGAWEGLPCSWVQLVPFPFIPELSHAASHVPKAEHPHASTAMWLHATSLIRCECTIWHFAEGHPGPSATSSGGKHLLGRRVQVERAMEDAGRRVGAVWLHAAPCRALWHAASSLQELKGDCGTERRREKKIKEIMRSASLKPWQKCSGCLWVMCCGKKRMLPFPSLLKCSLHREACAGALVPGGMCLGCAGSQDGGVRSVWVRLWGSPLSAMWLAGVRKEQWISNWLG